MTQLALYDLRAEYQTNPLGIHDPAPRLSWKIRSTRRGVRQTFYHLRVARTPGALESNESLLWDSGRVESDQSVHLPYQGTGLSSGERAWWQVTIWDESGNETTSDSAWWEMGLLERTDWEPAQWIGGPLVGEAWTTVPLPYLRRPFRVAGLVKKARLYVTALGLYECWLNGKRVGEDWFTPGWTDYFKRVQYQVYDVTDLLEIGENVWGALLGDGWYCGQIMHKGRQVYGDRPKFFAKLVITDEDGRTESIATDSNWRVQYAALLESDHYNGESYDARLEPRGWTMPGFDDHNWMPVAITPDPGIELSPVYIAPVHTFEELLPVAEPVEYPGRPTARWVFDFGQNIVGRVRLRIKGERGLTVRLRFAEVLNPDGRIYTTNLRAAQQTDTYTLHGEGEETWEPRFTFHGFRYVELQGFPGKPTRGMLTGIVMHSPTPSTGTFECSDPLVNQLQQNIVWAQKGNFFDVPTDCPQRDERMGWLGDAQVFIRTASFNMDVAAFFWKWTRDVMDAQSARGAYPPVVPHPAFYLTDDGGPAWADAGIICPWTIYLTYGDLRLLERHYESMQRFLAFLQSTSRERVRPAPGEFPGFGDWLALDVTTPTRQGVIEPTWEGGTPKVLIGTAFFAHAARLLARIARVLGRDSDAEMYTREFEEIRRAFQANFVSSDASIVGDTQTAYVLALHFDLLPEELRSRAVEKLVGLIRARGTHLATGFVGTPYLAHALTEGGRLDVAYDLLLQRSYPSWLFPVLNGATTIWERWDGWTPERGFQTPAMNSFNHYAYGAIGDWLYSVVAGINIDPAQPGYKHIVLQPRPGGALTFARATYESPFGMIKSDWKRNGDQFDWHVIIPPNTTATALVPTDPDTSVVMSGQSIRGGEPEHGSVSMPLVAGEYHFTSFLK